MSDWLRTTGDGRFILTLHIQPGAKKTEFAGLHGDALKIRLAAPPVDPLPESVSRELDEILQAADKELGK